MYTRGKAEMQEERQPDIHLGDTPIRTSYVESTEAHGFWAAGTEFQCQGRIEALAGPKMDRAVAACSLPPRDSGFASCEVPGGNTCLLHHTSIFKHS